MIKEVICNMTENPRVDTLVVFMSVSFDIKHNIGTNKAWVQKTFAVTGSLAIWNKYLLELLLQQDWHTCHLLMKTDSRF